MIDRIKLLIKKENLSSSGFSDEIDLQRSSLSHIMSGRNKPSLDFVMKVKNRFPEINTDWLIFGKGSIYEAKSDIKIIENDLFSSTPDVLNSEKNNNQSKLDDKIEGNIILDSNLSNDKLSNAPIISDQESKTEKVLNKNPSKVLLLYKNGTFDVFEN